MENRPNSVTLPVSVLNMSGQKVLETKNNTFNTQNLSKGIYIVNVRTESGESNSKLIVN